MKVAVEGCCHGDLDAIYRYMAELEVKSKYKVDLLLICGDFQAVRNAADLECMAVPDKYKELKDFHSYYSGQKKAPVLTVVIGGNHEASNYLWELYHGGWLAPNIYFLGHAGSVIVNGIRISGASGIFKQRDFDRGNHEKLPYDSSGVRSIYHIREYCTRKLSLLPSPTVFLSHDWPHQIEHHGDLRGLLARKKFLRSDVDSGQLGSPPLMGLLKTLRPNWWFSAHLHTRFSATVPHFDTVPAATAPSTNPDEIIVDEEDVDKPPDESISLRNPDEITMSDEEENVAKQPQPQAEPQSTTPSSVTNFLALDKCLPRRQFLEVIDIPVPPSSSETTNTSSPSSSSQKQVKLTYDPHWLAITRAFHPYFSLGRFQSDFPDEEQARSLVAHELEWVHANVPQKLGGGWNVQACQEFVRTAPPIQPNQVGKKHRRVSQPSAYTNPQTEAFCSMLEITNKINPKGS